MGRVEHQREACIGCGACVAIHPQGWSMETDSKTSIIGGTLRKDGWEEKTTKGEEYELHKEAAESCPVACIHITNDNGEKLL